MAEAVEAVEGKNQTEVVKVANVADGRGSASVRGSGGGRGNKA